MLEYLEIPTHESLTRLVPAFERSLAQELDVLSLRGRVCPVCFSDGSVAVFALLDYCYDDQTHALLDLLQSRGFRLNQPHLFVLPPPYYSRSTRPRLSRSLPWRGCKPIVSRNKVHFALRSMIYCAGASNIKPAIFTLMSTGINIRQRYYLRFLVAMYRPPTLRVCRPRPCSICLLSRGWISREGTARSLIR